MDEYQRLGGKRGVVIENMNCKSFSDFPRWKGVMENILDKYRGSQEPALIILFGQEAWASYLSLNDSVTGEVPVMCALTSRNVVLLPDDGKDLAHWMPESSDFYEDSLKHQVCGGFLYEYDIASNIRMIRAIYPDTKNIAFISDNTYGGVTLQAHVRKEMKQFPDMNLILLDGREHTIYTIVDELRKLPKHTAVLLGTWRVDKNEGYFMRNATYSMMEAIPDVPTFTATSIGLGYWAVGGVVPVFRTFGKELAEEAVKLLDNPEKKRKIIGKGFIDVFDEEAHKIKDVKWLAQGTIYPDCIESLSITGTVIKSHHNVGGLPEKMNLKLCEPLRLLFKDEVRRVGRELGMPEHLITRHPFPGPGLAVRILGDITPEKVSILQDADDIFIQGLRNWKVKDAGGNETTLYHQVWQAGVILLPVQSVGVMGDERTYERAVALRAVTSTDAMTADWAHLPYEFLGKVSNDIINKVKGVNRVTYDISSKPPSTIEWE